MRLRLVIVLSAVILFALPGLSTAQNREPHAGTFAIGADAGVYVPGPDFHAGFSPDFFLEFYLTGRLSLRGMGAFARPKADNDIDELRQFQGTLNLVVNWEADYWHPFVTAGVGGYGVQARSGGVDVGSMQALAGCNVGAGIEYFARPKITFKFEATYHYVQQGSLFASPSGLAASVGIKRYF
jgi:opacity protein-like surface antigen